MWKAFDGLVYPDIIRTIALINVPHIPLPKMQSKLGKGACPHLPLSCVSSSGLALGQILVDEGEQAASMRRMDLSSEWVSKSDRYSFSKGSAAADS